MKKLCFAIAAILYASAIRADLKEDFNSLSSGSWATETPVELPSGTWMFGGGLQYNKSNNVVSLKFNQTGAYLITPVLDSVTSVEFKHRSGGSKKQIDIAYRIGSGEWVEVNSVSSPSSSTFSTFSCKLGTDSALNMQVRFSGTNNTYIDDVVIKQAVNGSGDQGTVVPAEPDPEFTRPTYTATHATYHISPAGNDETGDGSFEKPWFNLGKAVSVLNKPESFLMVGIEDGCDLWLAGEKLEKGAYVAVSLLGNSKSESYEKMTGIICDILQRELEIPGNAVYVTYHPVADWGWNGKNF